MRNNALKATAIAVLLASTSTLSACSTASQDEASNVRAAPANSPDMAELRRDTEPVSPEIAETQELNRRQAEIVPAELARESNDASPPRPDQVVIPEPRPDEDALALDQGSESVDPAAINPETGKTYGQEHWTITRMAARSAHRVSRAFATQDAITEEERDEAIDLATVGQPADTLSTAKVDDENGMTIGPVYAVLLDDDGEPLAIEVEIGGGYGLGEDIVQLDADDLVYLPERNILIVEMTRDEVLAMHDEQQEESQQAILQD
jgi:hypothetical protein